MKTIVRAALNRRPVVLFATIIVLIGGLVGATQLRQQVFPDFEFPFLIATVPAPGLDSTTIDEQVGQPLAATAEQVDEVGVITTVASEGELRIYAELEFGTDVGEVTDEVLAGWEALSLPPGVGAPVLEEGFNEQAVIQAALLAESEAGVAELGPDAATLRDELSAVEGVARVDIAGVPEPRWLVTVDEAALARGVLPDQVAAGLQQLDLRATAGSLQSPEGFPLQVVVSGPEIESAAQLEQVVLPGLGELGGIAAVEEQVDPSAGFARTNGSPSVGISVFRETSADEVATVDGVLEAIDEFEEASGAEVPVLYETSSDIRASINGLLVEAIAGSLGAVLVIFLFLRSVRGTLVAAVSIPTSIVFGLLVAWWLGLTINIITLAGLTIAVGRVIDDGIVVLEAIYQRLERGETRLRAMVDGTADVATAIASSTVATIAVFLPIGLVGGLVSEIFLSFSIIVSVALAASLLVAVTVIPVVGSLVLRPSDQPAHGDTALQRIAEPATRFGVRLWWVVLPIALVAVIIPFALIATGKVPTQFLPGSGSQQVFGSVSLQPGTAPDEAAAQIAPLDERLNEIEGLEDVSIGYGDAAIDFDFQSTGSTASFFMVLDEDVDVDEVVSDLRAFGEETYPGVFRAAQLEGGPPSGQFQALVEGDDQAAILAASQQLVEVLEARDDTEEIGAQASRSVPQLVATVRPGAPVSPEDVERVLAGASGQQDAGVIGGTQVVVTGAGALEPASLAALPVPVEDGSTVPLGQVAAIEQVDSPAFVNRVDGVQAAQVSAKITSSNTAGAVNEIKDALAELDGAEENADGQVVLDGATFNFDQGDQAFINDMFRDLGIAMVIAVILVFLVVVVFFGSIALPFAVLAPVLFSFIGSLGALALASAFNDEIALGLPAMIGQLLLIGIIVSNSILLIDAALKHNKAGMDREESLVQAARDRVRPVLMTAFATIAALTPLATGLAATLGITEEGGIISQSLGIVVIGGLLVATLLTLVVVPAAANARVFLFFGPRLFADRRNDTGWDDDPRGDVDEPSTSERRETPTPA